LAVCIKIVCVRVVLKNMGILNVQHNIKYNFALCTGGKEGNTHFAGKKGNDMMKKLIAIVMTLVMILGAFAACSKGESSSSAASSAAPAPSSSSVASSQPSSAAPAPVDADLKAIAAEIDQKIGIAMKAELDEELLVAAFNLNAEDFEEATGIGTMINTKVNNIVLVKAKEGKVENVKKSLEDKLQQLRDQFETYLQDQFEVAKEGKVLVNGNYVALLILEDVAGEGAKTPAEVVAEAEKIFMDATGAK